MKGDPLIYSCTGQSFDIFACWSGNIAAFIFFLMYLPQIYLNWQRKSIKGFSKLFVFIKMIGDSFNFVNSIIQERPFPIILSSCLLLIEMIIFIIQFFYIEKQKKYFIALAIPFIPSLLSPLFPSSIIVTQYIHPICSIANYIPYIYALLEVHSTTGISLLSQHINFIGGSLGLLMCSISSSCDGIGWFYYFSSIIQSVTTFLIAIYYGEFRIFDSEINKTAGAYQITDHVQ